ncbi:uncharacterized protein CLUP02_18365 [Colletotrichum lupini]|uniref:Uncharacterized protein n=1 Tax=Colletotrichum lupini TaxID=145971 RepID=A0A9Q8WBT3_9PEZI|nr:uncharacterized protein CLUP02_18365 [Colletotrichum lupini]UQC76850.1 hypothetical protein CLUP02_18365 [Colletotrichum lupini]
MSKLVFGLHGEPAEWDQQRDWGRHLARLHVSLMGLIRTPLDNEITKAFAFPKTCTIGMLGSHYILHLSTISVWYMLDPHGISRAT